MHLFLATRSLLGYDDVASFITAFSGSHRYVVNYLLDEVPNRQSKAVQDFLVQTSLLEGLSTPLCDAVHAQGGSQALLDFLEHVNLFLVPLNDERHWYRYHHLFAETLYQPSGCSRRFPHWSRTYTVARAASMSSTNSSPRRSPMRWRLLLSRRLLA
jgi:ATP/maltotriose-dependent transcriptional regulator MalT